VDLATQNAWETSLMTYLNDIPFHYIGKGEQSIVKTNLAMSHSKPPEANLILLEEPENHLSHSKLNELIDKIQTKGVGKQIIISTHSSFVANKLNLGGLILLNNPDIARLEDLLPKTQEFFSKLAGYDTLRLILCKKAILVEGGSDEMVVQAAYMKQNGGRLPIEDGIDVISVGTSFLRFLEIAEKTKKKVVVVTDNDGDVAAVNSKYVYYLEGNKKDNIKICFDETEHPEPDGGIEGFNYNTLEPSLLRVNSKELFNSTFGTAYGTNNGLLKFMKSHKTDCALDIFDAYESIRFPQYILDAIDAIEDDHE
nr:ATP-dependent endonuclease [Pseudomonadota bacterium]